MNDNQLRKKMKIKDLIKSLLGNKLPANHPNQIVSFENMMLDLNPSEIDGKRKTHEEWIDYWNNIDDGRVFASMPQLYLAFKQLKYILEHNPRKEKQYAKYVVESLRKDFNWGDRSLLLTSTKTIYLGAIEDSIIIHNYGCKNPSLIKKIDVKIPVYNGIPIEYVAKNVKGLNYIQSLFNTEDGLETIMQTLELISNRKRNNIRIFTTPIGSFKGSLVGRGDCHSIGREDFHMGWSSFDYTFDDLRIYDDLNLRGTCGPSRGVRLINAAMLEKKEY